MDYPGGRSGFYKSTISKCSLASIVATSAFVQLSGTTARSLFRYDIISIINRQKFSHLLLAKLVFLDPSDLIFGCMAIYHFRLFERRFGSRKYLSSIIWLFVLSTAFELLSSYTLWINGVTLSVLPSGPFFLVYPFYVHYLTDVPNLSVISPHVLPLSRKFFLYFFALRLASSSVGSLVVCGCGLLAGLLHRFTPIRNTNLIPSSIAGPFSRILGPVFNSKAPEIKKVTIGATLELQRQEALDRQDQLLMNLRRAQIRHVRRRRTYVPLPHEIQPLTEMGFTEERVKRALTATFGDIYEAINLLQNPNFAPS
ncbi:hypothetical protein Aperf_G00000034077 [Anoplocephala perfoliata]